jgi:hypothetical protein
MSHLSSLRELHSAASYDENDGGGDAEAAKDGSGVSVAVTAGPTTVQLQGPSSVGNSWSEGAQDDGFLKRAGRRLRLRCGAGSCHASAGAASSRTSTLPGAHPDC